LVVAQAGAGLAWVIGPGICVAGGALVKALVAQRFEVGRQQAQLVEHFVAVSFYDLAYRYHAAISFLDRVRLRSSRSASRSRCSSMSLNVR
jgi:hypothetical protein